MKESAMLTAVKLAEFKPGNFSDGVGFIGRFEGTGQQSGFGHGLRSFARVYAGAAQVEQPLGVFPVGGAYDVQSDGEVVGEKFRGIGLIGHDASDFGGRDYNTIGLFLIEKSTDSRGVSQIEFVGSAQ